LNTGSPGLTRRGFLLFFKTIFAVNGIGECARPIYFYEMLTRIRRLFTIKTKFEAFAVIYALALGAADRGVIYMMQYPGLGGKLLFLACGAAVMMGGGKIIDAIDMRAELGYLD
tara:strand:- start:383 stop:724 length:342 start_codon:yes stop_codon:yes gene_type:complete